MVFINSHTGHSCSRVHVLGAYFLTKVKAEKWFYGGCGKICQTSVDVSSFAPGIPLPILSKPNDVEYSVQMVTGDNRSLIYTLS